MPHRRTAGRTTTLKESARRWTCSSVATRTRGAAPAGTRLAEDSAVRRRPVARAVTRKCGGCGPAPTQSGASGGCAPVSGSGSGLRFDDAGKRCSRVVVRRCSAGVPVTHASVMPLRAAFQTDALASLTSRLDPEPDTGRRTPGARPPASSSRRADPERDTDRPLANGRPAMPRAAPDRSPTLPPRPTPTSPALRRHRRRAPACDRGAATRACRARPPSRAPPLPRR